MSYKSVNSIESLYAAAKLVDSELAEVWEERLELIKHKVKFVKYRPSIVVLESLLPLKVMGKWVPELVYNAGGEALFNQKENEAIEISMLELQNIDADGIIISLKDKTLTEVRAELEKVIGTEEWQILKSVQKGNVFISEGKSSFHVAGEEIIETGEMIAEILQVNQFYYGMEGERWEQWAQKL